MCIKIFFMFLKNLSSVKWIAGEKLLYNTEAQPGAPWWPKGWDWDGEGGSQEKGHVYNYGWFEVDGRNQQNTVKMKAQFFLKAVKVEVLLEEMM